MTHRRQAKSNESIQIKKKNTTRRRQAKSKESTPQASSGDPQIKSEEEDIWLCSARADQRGAGRRIS
jgi:hypothetical protein